MRPQAEALVALMRAHPEGISRLDALRAGCGLNAPARILEIKAAGFAVRDVWDVSPDGLRFKRWHLAEPVIAAPIRGDQTWWF